MAFLRFAVPPGSPPAACIARRLAASALVLAASLLSACSSLPPLPERPAVHALPFSEQTPLGSATAAQARPHPGKTGVVAISDGHVAIAVRLALVRAAARSIDIQTYIWHADAAGTLLYDEVLRAADRGVRVRILLDDANTTGLDPTLALLDAHPDVEVRLYNPFAGRGSRALGYLGDFGRLNHRMHNKSFTVDNAVAVVGGRNIADEYFETGDQTGLVDLDAVAIGQVVGEVSGEFDLFWNSASAYPAGMVLGDVAPLERAELDKRARAIADDPEAPRYREAVAHSPLVAALLSGTLQPEWTTARVLHDDPEKTLDPPDTSKDLLLPRLAAAFGHPTRSLHIVSPYFVPGDAGTQLLAGLAQQGVQVGILTNSLAANDVKPVHAGYAKHRKALLRAGVRLYELRPEAANIAMRAKEVGRGSRAGLHAKSYAVDGRAIFIGSFNLDPRSARLNTEMGLVIDSPTLARHLASGVDGAYPALAYRVQLNAQGNTDWEDGSGVVQTVDPETSWLERTIVRIESWLPIEWLL
ncbi:phospholipase D family protein [Variovorax sp.]|uniref:phospholipase D family protein n=1 Tax=Variovorax sp. TaxID=1871043 RepID=UPI002D651645|nr:phospholipase D family protein [Variovorax sp.]HYP85224.1 phospholipase D family protein [Variovorax sp.]